MSVFCFSAPSVAAFEALLARFPFLPLLMGPPALLIHEFNYVGLYLSGTAIVFGMSWTGMRLLPRSEAYFLLVLGAAIVWVAFGFLTYVPGF
jgi:hypothetical protein